MDYRARVEYTLHDDWQQCQSTLAGHHLFAVVVYDAWRQLGLSGSN